MLDNYIDLKRHIQSINSKHRIIKQAFIKSGKPLKEFYEKYGEFPQPTLVYDTNGLLIVKETKDAIYYANGKSRRKE